MTDFITLSFTSNREIPTFSSAWNLKKVPLSGGASLYRILKGVPHWEKVLFYILLAAVSGEDEKENDSPKFCWRGGGGSTQATIDDYVGMHYSFF